MTALERHQGNPPAIWTAPAHTLTARPQPGPQRPEPAANIVAIGICFVALIALTIYAQATRQGMAAGIGIGVLGYTGAEIVFDRIHRH